MASRAGALSKGGAAGANVTAASKKQPGGASKKLSFAASTNVGASDAVFSSSGNVFVVGGTDQIIRVYSTADDDATKDIDQCNGDIMCLAAKDNYIASGDAAGDAMLHIIKPDLAAATKAGKRPGSESHFLKYATRLQSPVRAVAFNGSGLRLAVGGEAGEVKVINTSDTCQLLSLNATNTEAVLHLAFDASNIYLAVVNMTGWLSIYNTIHPDDHEPFKSRDIVSNVQRRSPNQTCKLAWSPSGSMLVVPGRATGEIVVLERETWKITHRLKEHRECVNIVSFHPSGSHFVSASLDGEILLWNAKSMESVRRWKHEHSLNALAWHPSKNTLLALDDQGGRALIQVTLNMLEATTATSELPAFTDDEVRELMNDPFADESFATSTATTAAASSTPAASKPTASSTSKTPSTSSASSSSSSSLLAKTPSSAKLSHPTGLSKTDAYSDDEDDALGKAQHHLHRAALDLAQPQAAFQAGATYTAKRRYLCWSLLGKIALRKEQTTNSISVEYTDATTAPSRPLRIPNSLDFTMASLGTAGALFANSLDAKNSLPSTISYRYFVRWTSKNEWSLNLPLTESATCLVAGSTWVAVASSANTLRVFSLSGIMIGLISLPGPSVCLCDLDDNTVVIAYHRAPPIGNSQCISLLSYNVKTRKLSNAGDLPLSPASTLIWLGVSELKLLSSIDSAGVCRMKFGSAWTPVLELPNTRDTYYWPVGFTHEAVVCAACTNGMRQPDPQNAHAAQIKQLPFRIPGIANQAQEEFVRQSLLVTLAKKSDPKPLSDLDSIILKQIQDACKSDDQLRALDLCMRLSLPKAVGIAIQIANIANLSTLSEKMNSILQRKRQEYEQRQLDDGSGEDDEENDDEEEEDEAEADADEEAEVEQEKPTRAPVPSSRPAIPSRAPAPKPAAATSTTSSIPTKARPVGVPSPDVSDDEGNDANGGEAEAEASSDDLIEISDGEAESAVAKSPAKSSPVRTPMPASTTLRPQGNIFSKRHTSLGQKRPIGATGGTSESASKRQK